MAKFVVQAIYRDYPITVEVDGVEDLNKIIDRLDGIGATPPTKVHSEAAQIEQERAAPVCPWPHETQFKGSWYFLLCIEDGRWHLLQE